MIRLSLSLLVGLVVLTVFSIGAALLAISIDGGRPAAFLFGMPGGPFGFGAASLTYIWLEDRL